jgi:catechol 2,3-dioxygenase-like lactoylglutathione lyase family enzyme
MHIGSVVIDCNDFDAMLAFWAEALHYVPREPAEAGWVVLRDPQGEHVNVSLQKVPETATEKNRLHFDLYSTDQAGEVERLLGIGATHHTREPEPDDDFVTLVDPDGNLFCVIDVAHD